MKMNERKVVAEEGKIVKGRQVGKAVQGISKSGRMMLTLMTVWSEPAKVKEYVKWIVSAKEL